MTPNKQQAEARKLLDLHFAAELMLIKLIRGNLESGIDDPGWDAAARKRRSDVARGAGSALKSLEADTTRMLVPLLAAAYAGGRASFRTSYVKVTGAQATKAAQDVDYRLAALLAEVTGQVSTADSRILRTVNDAYRRIIGQTALESTQNGITRRQTTQRALDRFAAAGISGFTTRDGRSIGMSEYAEMATRTALMRASLAGYIDDAIANGQDLIIITDHADECPLCRPWENKVLSITGAMREHPDCDGLLEDAIAAGLFHPNCLHSFAVYIPGLTSRWTMDTNTPAQNQAGYEDRQRMRYNERQVRAWKRRQAAAITPDAERRAQAYVRRWQQRIRDLSADTGTPIYSHRTGPRVVLSAEARALKPVKLNTG